jgi:hypothetical protein
VIFSSARRTEGQRKKRKLRVDDTVAWQRRDRRTLGFFIAVVSAGMHSGYSSKVFALLGIASGYPTLLASTTALPREVPLAD